MIIDDNIIDLVTEIEYMIGKECFNPKSTWQQGNVLNQGKQFRYPVHYTHPTLGEDWSTNYQVGCINAEDIESMCYHFGANHLYIGAGILNVLQMMEDRYGLDFNELERKKKE